jgi:hypothetical protein
MQTSVCVRGPILGIIGACFFVAGVVVFAVPPMSDVKAIVAGIFLGFAFLCLMVVSVTRGWCWSHVSVTNNGASRVPYLVPGPFPVIFGSPMRVEYHGLNSI